LRAPTCENVLLQVQVWVNAEYRSIGGVVCSYAGMLDMSELPQWTRWKISMLPWLRWTPRMRLTWMLPPGASTTALPNSNSICPQVEFQWDDTSNVMQGQVLYGIDNPENFCATGDSSYY
jgi:hypothetical protein